MDTHVLTRGREHMRKGRRFTPELLEKWHLMGRGTGYGSTYLPWHQVTRSDPGSRGRSHLLNWKFDRLHHLLSDHEKVIFAFLTMLPGVKDVHEQFPLPIESAVCVRPDPQDSAKPCIGTIEIAESLGFRHPVVRKGGIAEPWVMSTDYLVDLHLPDGKSNFLAISVKFDDELQDARKMQLLKIEREFWVRQNIQWLLLTPNLYDKAIVSGILAGMAWATDQIDQDEHVIAHCGRLQPQMTGLTLSEIINFLMVHFCIDQHRAQQVFWQTIWTGGIPLNLVGCTRPGARLEFLSVDAFWQQNPIVSRRTAWGS